MHYIKFYNVNKLYIEIIQVEDEKRNYYIYIPTEDEKNMLMKKLEDYIKGNYIQSVEEFIEEIEKEEEDEY